MKKSQVEHARTLVRTLCGYLKEPMALGQLNDALVLVIEMARSGHTLDAYDVASIPVDKLVARCTIFEDPIRRERARKAELDQALNAFTQHVCTNCGDTRVTNGGNPLGWTSNIKLGDGVYKLLCPACLNNIPAKLKSEGKEV